MYSRLLSYIQQNNNFPLICDSVFAPSEQAQHFSLPGNDLFRGNPFLRIV